MCCFSAYKTAKHPFFSNTEIHLNWFSIFFTGLLNPKTTYLLTWYISQCDCYLNIITVFDYKGVCGLENLCVFLFAFFKDFLISGQRKM